MASLNKIFIIGYLGKDVEVRTANGKSVARLSVATDESYTDRNGNRVDRTEWHTVQVWDRQADSCKQYLGKGSMVFVEGKLTTRKWQDQKGQDRFSTEIRADRVQFLDRKENGGQKPAQRQEQQQDSYPDNMDDIPF